MPRHALTKGDNRRGADRMREILADRGYQGASRRSYTGGAEWQAAEMRFLRLHYAMTDWRVIEAACPGRSRSAIAKKANDLGLKRDHSMRRFVKRDVDPIFEKLERARVSKGLSRQDLAAMLHCHPMTITRRELGMDQPSLAALQLWAGVLGLAVTVVPV